MTVRVQCLSGAVRSLLKVAVCLVVAAVTVMALSGLAGTTAEAQTHPASSCQPDTVGNDPCAGATGPIGENSCNGDDACVDSSSQIGAGSCNGWEACEDADGAVGAGSCIGDNACEDSSSDIGDCEFNFVYVDRDCDGLASDVDCDDNDALNVSRCAPRLPYPEIVNAPANADVGAWVLPNPTAGTDTAAAAPLSEVLALSEAPELAFTGTTSTVAATFAFALLGLGFLTLGEQRRRQDS